jgi:cation transport ATPase
MVNGVRLMLGNHRLIHEQGLCGPELEAELVIHEKQGRTVTLLADDSRVLALFAVADTIRETSKQAIVDLKALGVTSVMLTGDNTATAKAIAAQAGIDDARGDLLPEAKLMPSRNAKALWRYRHDRRRHQRCAGAGAGRHRLCHGRSGNRHGHGSGRRGHHER